MRGNLLRQFSSPRLTTMLQLLLLGAIFPAFVSAGLSFENTAIVRTAELGGSLVHVTTAFTAQALLSGSDTYTITLSPDERDRTSWLQVKLKGQEELLDVTDLGLDSERYQIALVELVQL
jgi:oligosaccharyltransferase complex subunit alpha (ribophorin I)